MPPEFRTPQAVLYFAEVPAIGDDGRRLPDDLIIGLVATATVAATITCRHTALSHVQCRESQKAMLHQMHSVQCFRMQMNQNLRHINIPLRNTATRVASPFALLCHAMLCMGRQTGAYFAESSSSSLRWPIRGEGPLY